MSTDFVPLPLAEQHRLVLANRPFSIFMAGRLNCGLPLDERIALADLGSVKAAQRFDPTRGVKFSSYSSFWIRAAIFTAAEREHPYAHMDRYDHEFAEGDHDEYRALVPSELRVEATQDVYAAEALDGASFPRRLKERMRRLDVRERRLIKRRYVDDKTLQEIADEWAISRERVRQLEARALVKMRVGRKLDKAV
jgi:RNA polymerase sigma factor (sigma-70 family)